MLSPATYPLTRFEDRDWLHGSKDWAWPQVAVFLALESYLRSSESRAFAQGGTLCAGCIRTSAVSIKWQE